MALTDDSRVPSGPPGWSSPPGRASADVGGAVGPDDSGPSPAGGTQAAAEPSRWAGWLDSSRAPVRPLSPSVLALEWRRTTAALATRLTSAAQQAVVQRRAEVLDEIERRNPAGFERWLSAGSAPDGDPDDVLDCGRTRGTEAA